MDILAEERKIFIKTTQVNPTLSIKNKADYFYGMGNAFDDAFNQYARREKKKYADSKNDFMKPIVDRLYSYFQNDDDSFEECYADCIHLSKEILKNNRYGIAQKFVNMSFKYLYCYDGAKDLEYKFQKCYMPLDKYTINWVKSFKNTEINKRLADVNSAWANLDEELYKDIQTFISEKLEAGVEYKISFNPNADNNGLYVLPKNKLYAEFIIWHQEKINELHNILEKNTADFERLGIKKL